MTTAPSTTAPPVASAQVDRRTGSTRPSAAHPATASASRAGTRSSGETSVVVDATCTSNGREKGAPTVLTARRASAASRQAATAGTTRLPRQRQQRRHAETARRHQHDGGPDERRCGHRGRHRRRGVVEDGEQDAEGADEAGDGVAAVFDSADTGGGTDEGHEHRGRQDRPGLEVTDVVGERDRVSGHVEARHHDVQPGGGGHRDRGDRQRGAGQHGSDASQPEEDDHTHDRGQG